MSNHDAVQHPKHYTSHPSGIECIQVTEHMGFNLGNATKYIWRADLKDNALEDLRKAEWYVQREIEKRGGASETSRTVVVEEATYDDFKAVFQRDRSDRDMAIACAVLAAVKTVINAYSPDCLRHLDGRIGLAGIIAKVGATQ